METDLDSTFQVWVLSFPVLYFSWNQSNQTLQFQKYLPVRQTILTFSAMYKKTQQWVLNPQAQKYAMLIPT